MKVIDTRTGKALPGRCVLTIAAGNPVPSREVPRIYGVSPNHRAYNVMTRPCDYDRMVLQLGTITDRLFRVLQKYPHHELVEDDSPMQDAIDAELLAEVPEEDRELIS